MSFKNILYFVLMHSFAYMSTVRVLLYSSFLVSPTSMVLMSFYILFPGFFSNAYSFFIRITAVLVQTVIVFSSVNWSPFIYMLPFSYLPEWSFEKCKLNHSPL